MAELLALDDKDKKKKAKQTGKVKKKKTSAAMEFVRNSAAITGSMLDKGGEEVHRHAQLEMASEDGQIGGAGGLEQAREASAHDATAPLRGFASKGSSQFVGGKLPVLV